MNNVHVIYASPRRQGFLHSCLEHLLSKLDRAENEIDFVDLYRFGFDPVLKSSDLNKYYDGGAASGADGELERLLVASETIIFVFPTWMYLMPAILKGYFDKIWRPNISFSIEEGRVIPLLTKLKQIIVICSAGQQDVAADAPEHDLIKEFFDRLAHQNTCGPAQIDYLKFDDRDTADAGANCTDKEISALDRVIANISA